MRSWLGPADAVLQQVAWWSAVLGAAHGRAGYAAAAGPALLAAHLLGRPAERIRVAGAAAAAALYGFATDTVLSAAGLLAFAGGGAASPAWMAGLWAAFGAALTASLARLARWPAVGLAAVAAAAGPIAYRAGAGLDALSFPQGAAAALAAVAAQWALGVPLLAWIARQGADGGARGGGGAAPPAREGGPRWDR
jgi:hypothetical protein